MEESKYRSFDDIQNNLNVQLSRMVAKNLESTIQ